MVVLTGLGRWYQNSGRATPSKRRGSTYHSNLDKKKVHRAIALLAALLFSKYIYLASFTSYYIFYLSEKFDLSTQTAQIYQFVFFAAVAAGTVAGGPLGDRFGRKIVIWVSILGVLPLTLIFSYVGLPMTIILSVLIGLIISSAFPAIVVFG